MKRAVEDLSQELVADSVNRDEVKAEVMSEPGINHLTDFALFLPFSCNERQQLAAIQCNAETLEVIDKAEETVLYG